MDKIYYDPRNPGSFSSIANLARAGNFSTKDARNWLLTQDTYTLHRAARKRFPRNKYYVDNIDDLWQADLCDMRTLSSHNDNTNYLMTVIDAFSRYAWVRALKTKHNASIKAAFQDILDTGRKCVNLETDKGSEFVGKGLVPFFAANKINFFTTKNPDVKASLVERFNKTLKHRMWRYLSFNNSFRYIDVLQDLVYAYNHSVHSVLKMRPCDVNETNVLSVWRRLYAVPQRHVKPKLAVGVYCRISKKKSMFEKGYETNFTEEIFKIIRVLKRSRPVYELEDLNGEKIDGYFYEHEVQPVVGIKDKSYKIDKILGRRKNGTIREVFVSWVGYPASFNSWIPESNLLTLK